MVSTTGFRVAAVDVIQTKTAPNPDAPKKRQKPLMENAMCTSRHGMAQH